MKVISFATPDYFEYQKRLTNSCSSFNVDTTEYNPSNLDKIFVEENKGLFQHARGYGYWIWKPYLILKELQNMKEGDFLFYCDADVQVIKNPIELTNKDLILCSNYERILNKYWIKRECYELIDRDITNNQHLEACVIGVKNNKENIEFIKEWYGYCKNERYITDNIYMEQLPEFRDHRHDQALLTIMAEKHYKSMIPIGVIKQYFNINK